MNRVKGQALDDAIDRLLKIKELYDWVSNNLGPPPDAHGQNLQTVLHSYIIDQGRPLRFGERYVGEQD